MTMVDLREQPRCARCGCRRIHHTRMARIRSNGPAEETMRSCAVFGCRCPEYRANMGRARPQSSARH